MVNFGSCFEIIAYNFSINFTLKMVLLNKNKLTAFDCFITPELLTEFDSLVNILLLLQLANNPVGNSSQSNAGIL